EWPKTGVWLATPDDKQSSEIATWDQLQAAHRPEDQERLDEIAAMLEALYPPLTDSAQRRDQLRRLLGKRVRVGDTTLDEATRFGFQDPASFAAALVALICRCSRKTVQRACADLLSTRK
ncbi:MAG: hypothetical protein L0170_17765, partial [Acidobacteria bacterium]|nr:hypothetical protein [Acidobacteriota bacterium]